MFFIIMGIAVGMVLVILVAALYFRFCRRRPYDSNNTNATTANTTVNTHSSENALARANTDTTESAVAVAVILNSSAIEAGEVIPVAKAVT